ncbi:conjugal transfer protein TrbL family protein [Halobacillus naozhouensis]|uniref:TrbL/VirB6 plasmid conjugal transfer protein n=1 Tax=Halobacillus naozhouensis TaxID=554880 RepID=A0ABY8J8M2_9BACI|nr:conjugal transfer protein TrbL family protein [Halobacillus naozhouensis]WFT77090.1 hypothetical protein P9989_21525 [Halobacillus naozhouensis]
MITEWINDYLIDWMEGMLQGAWKLIEKFTLSETNFSETGVIGEVQQWFLISSISITTLFIIFNLMKQMTAMLGGYTNRSITEIVMKGIFGVTFAYAAPWLLINILLKVANAFTAVFIAKGINIDSLKKIMDITNDVSTAMVWCLLAMCIAFVWLMFQYIIRWAQLIILWVMAPLAASTMVNEEMNVFPAWWREAAAIAFMQPLQVMILYFVVNLVGSAQKMEDMFLALGLMFVVIVSPSWLRKFLYSTGAGKSMISAAGGAGKMAMMKLMYKR